MKDIQETILEVEELIKKVNSDMDSKITIRSDLWKCTLSTELNDWSILEIPISIIFKNNSKTKVRIM